MSSLTLDTYNLAFGHRLVENPYVDSCPSPLHSSKVQLPPLWVFALQIPASSTPPSSKLCIFSSLCYDWTPTCGAKVKKLSINKDLRKLWDSTHDCPFSQRLESGTDCGPMPENNCSIYFTLSLWLFKAVELVQYQLICLIQKKQSHAPF